MLPFLKNKDAKVAGVIVKTRAPDEKPESEESQDIDSIEICAEELVKAIHAKDSKAVAEALKDIFTILESQPHEEGEHIEKHSYDAQNIKAGENR